MPDENGKLTEEEAIAKVARMGLELQESSFGQAAWYAFRIGVASVVLGIASLLMLFAFTVVSKPDGVPVAGLLISGILIAGGGSGAFWGYQNK
jgi:hypothetical protein